MTAQESEWQHTIWRSWRHSDDAVCARHLFDLVTDERGGRGVRAGAAALGAAYGAAAAMLVVFLASSAGGELLIPPALLGGAGLGALLGLVLALRLTWRQWLGRLSPASAGRDPESPRGRLDLLVRLTEGLRPRTAGPRSLGRLLALGGLVLATLVLLALGGARLALPLGLAIGVALGLYIGLVGGLAGVLVVAPPTLLLAGGSAGLTLLLDYLDVATVWRWGLHGLAGGLGGVTLGVMLAGLVALLTTRPHAWEWRGLWSWWRGRPVPAPLEQALVEATRQDCATEAVWGPLLHGIAGHLQQPPPVEELLGGLASPDWGERFRSYHVLVALGGEVVAPLRELAETGDAPLPEVAFDLLVDIAHDTRDRLGELAPMLLCKSCLVRCTPVHIGLPGPDLHYYGCRSCGQTRNFLPWPGQVVAVVDRRMVTGRVQRGNVMWVNWLQRRAPFDFERVEIGRASDAEVEGLAAALGNDADPLRRERYSEMRCHVASGSMLTENTLRILRRTFGQVLRE